MLLAAAWILSACETQTKNATAESQDSVNKSTIDTTSEKEVFYTMASHYFVKNTLDTSGYFKIETEDKFNAWFGMATTMGNSGKPTEIDFNKQYVIAIISPETDESTSIEPVSFKRDKKGKLHFHFKTHIGLKQSYTIKPALVIIIDKSDTGQIEFLEEKIKQHLDLKACKKTN